MIYKTAYILKTYVFWWEKKFTVEQIRKYKIHGSKQLKDNKNMYSQNGITTPVITGCSVATPKSMEFRPKLGLDQNKMILTKE